MPDFDSRDPRAPGFWDERFATQFTPWDLGGVPQALRDFVAAHQPMVTYIPGCGSAHEAAFLCAAGWEVAAIDFSSAAVAQAQAVLGPDAHRVRQADFFTHVPSPAPQVIYERAFLCALPRDTWPEIVQRWTELLPSGGLVAGFFYFDEAAKGPPFGASPAELEALLNPFFERIADEPVTDSIAVFAGRERWQVWRRL